MAYVESSCVAPRNANTSAVHACPIEPGRNEVVLLLDVDGTDYDTVLRSVCGRIMRTATALTQAALKIRVQCFPRNMEKYVTRHLDSLGYALETQAQYVTHTVSIVRAGGAYVVGVCRGCLARHWRSSVRDAVCRAFSKLHEAFVLGQFALPCEGMAALDVGSAPGGWTAYLCSEQVRCRRVVAIDPGAMQTPLPTAAEHLQMPAQEAVAKLLDGGDGAGSCGTNRNTFGAFVCDANLPPCSSLDILASAAPLLQKGAFFVITMKNTFRKQAAFDEAVRSQIKRLQRDGLCTDVRVVHLLANTTKELTLLGRFS